MNSKIKFSKISQMPSEPERDAIYFLKTPTNRMRIIVTSGDETPEPIEAEYGLGDYQYTKGTTTLSETALTTNLVIEMQTTGSTGHSYVEFTLTDTGDNTGTPLFKDLRLCHIVPLVISDINYPSAFIRAIDHINHRIDVVIKQANMDIGSGSPSLLDNDVSVTLRIQICGPTN